MSSTSPVIYLPPSPRKRGDAWVRIESAPKARDSGCGMSPRRLVPPGCSPVNHDAVKILASNPDRGPDVEQLVFVDINDTVRHTYGYAKQGSGRAHTGVKD